MLRGKLAANMMPSNVLSTALLSTALKDSRVLNSPPPPPNACTRRKWRHKIASLERRYGGGNAVSRRVTWLRYLATECDALQSCVIYWLIDGSQFGGGCNWATFLFIVFWGNGNLGNIEVNGKFRIKYFILGGIIEWLSFFLSYYEEENLWNILLNGMFRIEYFILGGVIGWLSFFLSYYEEGNLWNIEVNSKFRI